MGVLGVQGGKCAWEAGREMEKRRSFINRNSMYENATTAQLHLLTFDMNHHIGCEMESGLGRGLVLY